MASLTIETNELCLYYARLSFFQQFFFPSALKKALTANNPDPFNILRAATSSCFFYHLYLFPRGLGVFFKSSALLQTKCLADPQALPLTMEGKWPIKNQDELNRRLPAEAQHEVNSLLSYFNQATPFEKSYLFPAALVTELKKPQATALTIIHSALKNTGLFHRLFSPRLAQFLQKNSIRSAKELIENVTWPTGVKRVARNHEFLNRLSQSDRAKLLTMIAALNRPINNPKAQRNFDAIRNHSHPTVVIGVLDALIDPAAPCTAETQLLFNSIINGMEKMSTVGVIELINQMGIQSNVNLQAILKKQDALGWVDQSLRLLSSNLTLTQEQAQHYFTHIIMHTKPYELYHGIWILSVNNQLTTENLDAIINKPYPDASIKQLPFAVNAAMAVAQQALSQTSQINSPFFTPSSVDLDQAIMNNSSLNNQI